MSNRRGTKFGQVLHTSTGIPIRNERSTSVAPADSNMTITLQDRLYNMEVTIKQISPYKTYRSLGTEQGTSKNQTQQHEKLMNKSGAHNRKLACSAMSP
jgi:hypothetical protein